MLVGVAEDLLINETMDGADFARYCETKTLPSDKVEAPAEQPAAEPESAPESETAPETVEEASAPESEPSDESEE